MATVSEETKCIIISLIISNPTKTTVRQLSKDFFNIEGRQIPFMKMGFFSLEEYLRSIPDIVRIYGSGPHAEVEGVVTSKSQHINEMILKQKKPSHNISHNERRRQPRSFSNHHSGRYGYKSNTIEKVPSFKESNQEHFYPPMVNIPSKDSSVIEENTASSDEDYSGTVPSKIRNNLKKLIKHFFLIKCSKLPIEYKKMFNEKISYEEYNFRSLIEMCSDMPEIFRYVKQGSDEYVLYDCSKPIPLDSELIRDIEKKYVCSENVATTRILEELPNLNWSTASPMIPENVVQISDKIYRFFPADIAVGDILDISIGEIYDLSKFWVYMIYGGLEQLMKDLQTFYSNNRGCLIPEVLIQEGLYCVSLYCNQYHRCVIVNLLPKLKGSVRVFYIDYGTVGNVSSNQLWFLSKQFAELPCQAIRARLSNIRPIYENRPWSSAAVVKFEKLVSKRDVVAEITRIDEKDHFIEVYLADITNEKNIFYINDLLIKDGFARYVGQESKKTFVDVDCRPHVGYIHLYPEFYEIESGTVPMIEEMKRIITNKVPLHNYIPQYFDICYSEDTKSIQKQYEQSITKKMTDITSLPLKDEFDLSYFPSCIADEIENIYEEQNQDKKIKFKSTNPFREDVLLNRSNPFQSTSTNPFLYDTKETDDVCTGDTNKEVSDIIETVAVAAVEPPRRVRTPPGFSSLSSANRMPLNVNMANYLNNLYLGLPSTQMLNSTFFVPNQFGVLIIQPNMSSFLNSIASMQFNFNNQNV